MNTASNTSSTYSNRNATQKGIAEFLTIYERE